MPNQHEFILDVDAPNHIIVKTEVTKPIVDFLDGELIDPTTVNVPFTKLHALKIREYLTGKSVFVSNKAKAVLKALADTPDDKLKELIWSTDMLDLKSNKFSGRFVKIKTEWDLIHYLPLRYIDRTNPQSISDLQPGDWATIIGTVATVPEYVPKHELVKITVEDHNGQRITAAFFNQKWLSYTYYQGDKVILYGNYSEYVRANRGGGRSVKFPQISSPKIDKQASLRQGRLTMIPVYPQKKQDKSLQLQRAQSELLDKIVWIEDPIPEKARKKYELMHRNDAYREVHFPTSKESLISAQKRIAFDEFIRLQIYLEARRKTNNEENWSHIKDKSGWKDRFVNSLPFTLTDGQLEVIDEIAADLKERKPMYRLLQGDVGSGKTELSEAAALITAEAGYQVALLAPTDSLAQQLYDRYVRTIANANITELEDKIVLLKGSHTPKQKREATEKINNGEAIITIGTHSIVQKTVTFKNLGLAIVDEQHKFGVDQRDSLRKKQSDGSTPDFLSMSATPIPRATAQIVYGDMDISIVKELPAGRIPIKTFWSLDPKQAWQRTREEVEAGHQAYVVTSLVEESEKIENVESAEETYLYLGNQVFPDLRVGLLHGKLKASEKKEVLESYKNGNIDILVATSVVEVGINVPNSTVMTILDANRFGIASLHQIRGRVGRDTLPSFCYLIGDPKYPDAEERLNALVESTDGFWLAEKDLEIRGEGTLFSQVQSGENDMSLANLKEYKQQLELAKEALPMAYSSKELHREVSQLYKDKVIKA